MTRETLYAALFAFFSGLTLGGSPLFKTATRKGKTWEDVAPEDSPALLMTQITEEAQYRKGLPTKWRLGLKLMLYVNTQANNDPETIPSQLLNPLLDAVQTAFTIDDKSNDCCTLGGLVSHAAINGAIEVFEGNLGDEAVAIIPIEIVLASLN